MPTTLTAELALNTEQFARASRQATAGLGADVEKAGQDAAKKFDAALTPGLSAAERKIKETLRRAMTATPDGGILNLDLPGLRAGAAAADAKAIAARNLAAAMEAVNTSTQGVTRSQQLQIAAAQSVATKFEEQARAANSEVLALERLQSELGQTATSHQMVGKASNAHRAGLQNVGFQLQDFAVQVAGGTSAVRAASLQLPQLIGALQVMGNTTGTTSGKFATFSKFIGGPWGIALGVAVPVVGMFAEKMFGLGNEAEKAKPKVDALRKAIEGLTAARGRANLEQYGQVQAEILTSEATVSRLDKRIADLTERQRALTGNNAHPGALTLRDGGSTLAQLQEQREAERQKSEALNTDLKAVDLQISARKRGEADATRQREADKAEREAASAGRKAEAADKREAAKAAKDAAKEAERGRDAEESLRKSLTENVASMSEAAEVARVRSNRGEEAVAQFEAQLRITRQFPELTRSAVDDTIKLNGVNVKVTQTMVDQLALLRAMAGAEVDRKARAEDQLKLQEAIRDNVADIARLSNARVALTFAANDNDLRDLARDFEDLFSNGVSSIWTKFLQDGRRALADLAAEKVLGSISVKGQDILKRIAGNAGMGAAAAGMTGGNGLGGAAGGALGGELGKSVGPALAKTIGGTLGKTLGGLAGPLGSVLGGVLGGVVGNLFKKAPSAGTVVTSVDGKSQVTGNNANAQAAVSGISVSLQTSLQKIIDALGGAAGSFAVSIGKREDYYRVAGTNTSAVSAKHPNVPLLYNGTDAQEALRIAILDAIQDGGVAGISATIKNIITSNQDIDMGLSKATRLQQAFKDFKALTDPVGAAMDELNLKFRQLNEIAKEGGASQSELDNLRKLYDLQKQEALKQAGAAAEGLKAFLQSLKAGDTSPLALRDQERNAAAALEPFKKAILAGQSVDNDAFQKAAQTFLGIEQQINGSTSAYFAQFDLIVSLTEKAIARIDNEAKTTQVSDVLGNAIASATQASANILEQQTRQLAEHTELLQKLADAVANNNGAGFLSAARGY